jgi:nitronate monooxygenase
MVENNEQIDSKEQLDYKEYVRLPIFKSEEEKWAYMEDIGNREKLFPLIQGGMGLQVSNVESATAVSNEGGIGTLSGAIPAVVETYEEIDGKNLGMPENRKISHANNAKRFKADIDAFAENTGHQIRAVNIMKAVTDFEELVEIAGKSEKVDMLFVGAGLYTKCSEAMEKYPHMKFVPIVSSEKVASFFRNRVTKKSTEKLYAIYIEHPFAGGHDGYEKNDDYTDHEAMKAQYNPQKLYNETRETVPDTPLILGGSGIADNNDVKEAYDIGFSGVASGTMFSLAEESGFPENVKKEVILNKKMPTIVTKSSPANMLSTSVDNGFLARLEKMRDAVVKNAEEFETTEYTEYFKKCIRECIDCIGANCQFRKGKTPYCIADALKNTILGKLDSLVFTGKVRDRAIDLPIFENGNIPTTKEIYAWLAGNEDTPVTV